MRKQDRVVHVAPPNNKGSFSQLLSFAILALQCGRSVIWIGVALGVCAILAAATLYGLPPFTQFLRNLVDEIPQRPYR